MAGTSYRTTLTDFGSTYSSITCQASGCKAYVGGMAIVPVR
jgi:hypothetical protein